MSWMYSGLLFLGQLIFPSRTADQVRRARLRNQEPPRNEIIVYLTSVWIKTLEFVSRFRSHFRLSTPRIGPPAPLPSVLGMLAPELWQHIASYLDPKSAASLTLASRQMLRLLGTQYWDQLNDPDRQLFTYYRAGFLVEFGAQLPGHWFCNRCVQWHSKSIFHLSAWKHRNEENFTPLTTLPVYKEIFDVWPGYVHLSFADFVTYYQAQSAMRALRYGPKFGTPLRTGSKRDQYGWNHHMESKLVNNSLLIRYISEKETWIENIGPLTSEQEYYCYFGRYPPLGCRHDWFRLVGACACALRHVNTKTEDKKWSCNDCRGIRSCVLCPTEYRVKVRRRADNRERIILQVCRWSDLGDCQLENALWSAHTMSATTVPSNFRDHIIRIRSSKGSIRKRFENEVGIETIDDIVYIPCRATRRQQMFKHIPAILWKDVDSASDAITMHK